MDSLVSRLKKIVVQPKITTDDVDVSNIMGRPAVAKYKSHNGVNSSSFSSYSEDPQVIRTLIKSIPERFYNNESDKVVEEEIEEFCEDRQIIRTQTRISKLAAHNKAVCRRIYQLVLEKQPQYQIELNNVLILQQKNLEALQHCQAARNNMELAMDGLVINRLSVLVNYRRKCRLEKVYDSLKRIKTLQLSVEILMELLEAENFSKAIEVYTECQAVVDDFALYVCIDKMRKKLKTIRVNLEEALDSALMRMCENFDPYRYTMLQKSFELLGSGPSSIDQFQMHFTTVIQARSLKIIVICLGNVTLSNPIENTSYPAYCQLVPQTKLIQCVLDLCHTLFEIVRCYQAAINWHTQSLVLSGDGDTNNQSQLTIPSSTSYQIISQSNWSENYQLERLMENKGRLWSEVCSKVKVLIEHCQIDCSGIDLEDVMKLLGIVNRFTTIGIKFCENQSLDLQEALRVKFQDFFRSYHIKHLERLKMFLENELWEICPVKKSFSFRDLAEFSSFSRYLDGKENVNPTENVKVIDELDRNVDNPFIIESFVDGDNGGHGKANEESLTDNSLGTAHENNENRLSRNISEEEHNFSHTFSDGPIIANTTLEVCRLIGRYIEIMRLLKPIALDIINSLCQLYDYYMFSIYYIFYEYQLKLHGSGNVIGSESTNQIPRNTNSKLGVVLRRIWERLILHDNEGPGANQQATDCRISLPHPCISVNTAASKYSSTSSSHQPISDPLSQAIVAVESVVYLGSQFLRAELLDAINQLLPEAKRGLLRVFSEQNLLSGAQLRQPILELILNLEFGSQHRKLVSSILGLGNAWNGRMAAETPSEYVLRDIQKTISEYDARLSRISATMPLSRDMLRALWLARTRPIDHCMLEGFASITTCSQGGRNQMLVDWQSYVRCVDASSGIRDLFDNNDSVEKYIKAYYNGVSEFEAWLLANKDRYQRTHLVNLIGLISKTDKRLKQKWTTLLINQSQSSESTNVTSGSSGTGNLGHNNHGASGGINPGNN